MGYPEKASSNPKPNHISSLNRISNLNPNPNHPRYNCDTGSQLYSPLAEKQRDILESSNALTSSMSGGMA